MLDLEAHDAAVAAGQPLYRPVRANRPTTPKPAAAPPVPAAPQEPPAPLPDATEPPALPDDPAALEQEFPGATALPKPINRPRTRAAKSPPEAPPQ